MQPEKGIFLLKFINISGRKSIGVVDINKNNKR